MTKDVAKQKYVDLMSRVRDIEDQISDCESALTTYRESSNQDKIATIEERVRALQEQLGEARNELARVSDGCGTGHTM